jgi:uncharacterized repeat protein (TIGR02543 family)
MKKKILLSVFLLATFAFVLVSACNNSPGDGTTTYTVTFNSTGGSPTPPSQTVASEGTVTEPALPKKTGYIFDNWFQESEAPYNTRWIFKSDPLLTPDKVNEDITLYAKWFPDIPITISFYYNETTYPGGTRNDSVVLYPTQYLALNEFSPPPGTNPGFVFQHWYNATDLSKSPVSFIVVGEADHHFIAAWVEEVTVTFNTNGGTAVNPVKVGKGETIDLIEKTTSKGTDLFDGWYLDAAYVNPAPSELEVASNMTLYARWYSKADIEVYAGIWKHSNGKITYLINNDLTAWYFDDATYDIRGMRWRPMTLGSVVFTMNAEGDTLSIAGANYSKATFTKAKAGNEELSTRWVTWDGVKESSTEFTLKEDGTGSLEYTDPSSQGKMDLLYAVDNDNVYLLNKDGYVLLTIVNSITKIPDDSYEGESRWLDNYFREQELVTPGIERD